MDIGKPKRIVTVEPLQAPKPEKQPVPEPKPVQPEKVPA